MALTEREKEIICLKKFGYSDYRIGRLMLVDPENVGRSWRKAVKRLSKQRLIWSLLKRLVFRDAIVFRLISLKPNSPVSVNHRINDSNQEMECSNSKNGGESNQG